MNAIISGNAGIALLVDGEQLSSYHIDSPEKRVPRSPDEYPLLFSGNGDLEFLDDVSAEEVDRRLTRAVDRARSLNLALLLIDGTWSTATREHASQQLEHLLEAAENKQYVQSVLYSLPLPPGEAVQSALLLCSGPKTRALLAGLIRDQRSIAEVREAWDKATDLPEREAGAHVFARTQAVKEGLFHSMVEFHDRGASLGEVEQRASASEFGRVAGWHELLKTWAAPVEKRWHEANEIMTRYWGYLEGLRSPRPPVKVAGPLWPLEWPKPAPVLLKPESGVRSLPAVVERPDELKQVEHGHDIMLHLNSLIERSAKTISRIRLRRRLPYFMYAVVALLSLLAFVFFDDVLLALIDLVTVVVSIAGIVAAIIVFQLLNEAFGGSRTSLLRSIARFQHIQGTREEFDLAWAASLAPTQNRIAWDLSSAVRPSVLEEETGRAPAWLGALNRRAPREHGALRLLLGNVDALRQRSFTVYVDGTPRDYVGTNSVALKLPAGPHALRLSGTREGGDAVEARIHITLAPDEITERSIAFP